MALQTIVSRETHPLDSAVVTVGKMENEEVRRLDNNPVRVQSLSLSDENETKRKVQCMISLLASCRIILICVSITTQARMQIFVRAQRVVEACVIQFLNHGLTAYRNPYKNVSIVFVAQGLVNVWMWPHVQHHRGKNCHAW